MRYPTIAGTCTVESPVAFAFECQLAAFGAYAPMAQAAASSSSSRDGNERAIRITIARDDGMLACPGHHPPAPADPSDGYHASDSYANAIVLVNRGVCAFQAKLVQAANKSSSDGAAIGMILINSEDALLPMSTLIYDGDAQHGIAVSVTRSDGERLRQLVVQQQQTVDGHSHRAVTIRITSDRFRTHQVLSRIQYLLRANLPLVAYETYMDEIPSGLRDLDTLLLHLDGSEQLSTDPILKMGLDSEAQLVESIAFFHECALAFAVPTCEFAGVASLHAAAAAVVLSKALESREPTSAVVQSELWRLAAHALADAGYYDQSVFCFQRLVRHQQDSTPGSVEDAEIGDAVSNARCELAFVEFVQGNSIYESLTTARHCLESGRSVDFSIPSLRVAHKTLVRLSHFDISRQDVLCLQQADGLSTTTQSDANASIGACCQLQTLPSRDDTCAARKRRQPFAFLSRFVEEVFHALNLMGVFLDELGAFNVSLRFFAHAEQLCPDDVSLALRRTLAVPVVFQSVDAITTFYERLHTDIGALEAKTLRDVKHEPSTGSAATDATSELRPEDATYLQYTITPPTMFIGYQVREKAVGGPLYGHYSD